MWNVHHTCEKLTYISEVRLKKKAFHGHFSTSSTYVNVQHLFFSSECGHTTHVIYERNSTFLFYIMVIWTNRPQSTLCTLNLFLQSFHCNTISVYLIWSRNDDGIIDQYYIIFTQQVFRTEFIIRHFYWVSF